MNAESAEPELPRAVALAWGVAATPQRGPKREMSIEKIVDAAIEIADAEGLGAVSMSRVAQSLGFTTMSLYRYVTSKDDLVALMQETGTGLPPEPEEPFDDWQRHLTFLFHEQLALYRRHPWLLDVPVDASPVTPNGVAWLDAMLDALAGVPIDEEERLGIVLLLTGQVRWQGTVERADTLAADPRSADAADLYEALITAEEFPAMRRAVDAGVFRGDADPFAFGLDRLLDGVAGYLAARGAGAPSAVAPPAAQEDQDVLSDKKLREAQKATRDAEKELRNKRKEERGALREARQRVREARERAER